MDVTGKLEFLVEMLPEILPKWISESTVAISLKNPKEYIPYKMEKEMGVFIPTKFFRNKPYDEIHLKNTTIFPEVIFTFLHEVGHVILFRYYFVKYGRNCLNKIPNEVIQEGFAEKWAFLTARRIFGEKLNLIAFFAQPRTWWRNTKKVNELIGKIQKFEKKLKPKTRKEKTKKKS